MFTKLLLALVAASAISTSASSQSALDSHAEEHLIEALQCKQIPNPTTFLAFLAKRQYIKLSERIDVDSTSCWKLKRPFVAKGLPISGVCAAVEDGLTFHLYPDLYWRGPGTSPGTFVQVITTAPRPVVDAWVAHNKISPKAVDASYDVDGAMQVQCTEWMAKP